MAEIKKLNVWAASGAGMFTWMILMLTVGIGAYFGWGVEFMKTWADLYIGFDKTPVGILIGALWGAFDGFLCGALFAALYNWVYGWCPLIKKKSH